MDWKKWAKENIIWSGSHETNKSSRRGHMPFIIVNHISEGSMSSMISWFNSANNDQSSAHFGVAKNGDIHQFVAIEDNAWANGVIQKPSNNIVKRNKVNPNWYSVSIEHEGIHAVTKGGLTSSQLEATIMLHKYIIWYCRENFGTKIELNRDYIMKHSEIDSIGKPFCAGELFPIDTIVHRLNPKHKFQDVDGHWAYEAIDHLYKLGYMVGRSEYAFAPNEYITRAEFATVISKILKDL